MATTLNQTGLFNLTRAAAEATAPGSADDITRGFSPGSIWFNTATGAVYIATDTTAGAAIWQLFQPNALGSIIGANMNVTTDQAFAMRVPTGTRFAISAIVATNASISLTTAAGGVYPAVSKGGTAIVAAAQVYTALTGTAATKVDLTLAAGVATTVYSAPPYFSLTTAQGAAATADLYLFGRILNGAAG